MSWPRWLPEPFIVCLIGAVAVAAMVPARGSAAPVVDGLVTAAIMLLFFMHGAKLPREALWAAITHWRLHLAILAMTFAVFPLVGILMRVSLPGLLSPALWAGMLFLCVLPSTVQSSIAFTSIARGNVAAAVTAASASNLIGMALTPVLASLLLGTSSGAGVSLGQFDRIIWQLLLPFVVGHLLRPWLATWIGRHRALIGFTDRSTIILAVYAAFSHAVIGGLWSQVSVAQLVALTALCGGLLAIIMGLGWQGGRLAGFSREDRIAMLMCGSKKSLAAGVPMAKVLLPATAMGMMILPLMIFHQIQLIVCAMLARRLAGTGTAKG